MSIIYYHLHVQSSTPLYLKYDGGSEVRRLSLSFIQNIIHVQQQIVIYDEAQ